MNIPPKMALRAGLAALLAIMTAGCNFEKKAESAGAAAGPAANQIVFINAALGSAVGENGELANPRTVFAMTDDIKAVAVVDGQDGREADIKVQVLGADGTVLSEASANQTVKGKSAVVVDVKPPAANLGAGDYVARFYSSSVPSWEVKFSIK